MGMVSVTVVNNDPTGACTNGTNALQASPQASSPPPQTPWLVGTTVATQPLPASTGSSGAAQVAALPSLAVLIVLTWLAGALWSSGL